MTTDKLTNALVAILEGIKPDPAIAVCDARQKDEIDLPTIAVDVQNPDKHSLALPGVMKCPVEIVLRAHYGDDETRDEISDWADTIEREINLPSEIRDAITAQGLGLQCDYFQLSGGATSWDDNVMETTFSAEAWVVRTA